MINAGTVAAYLTLDTSAFDSGINSAMMSISGFNAGSVLIKEAVNGIKSVLDSAGKFFSSGFAAPAAAAAAWFMSVWNGIPSVVGASKISVASACSGIVSSASSALSRLPSAARAIMVQTGQGMVSGLVSTQSSIFAKAQSIANTVAAKMRAALGIHSPSRVMREIGRFTIEGMALGMSENTEKIREQASAAANLAIDAMQTAPPRINYAAAQMRMNSAQSVSVEQQSYRNSASSGSAGELSVIADKLDRCIRLMSQQSSALEIDGRSFGRLVREYS